MCGNFSVLGLIKIRIYDLRYNHILRKYGNDTEIFFTATNSLCYKSHTKDVLEI